MRKINLILSVLAVMAFFSCEDLENKPGCQQDDQSCENGECRDDGNCDCFKGYTGQYCGSEKTPAKITIKSIKLVEWPFYTEDSKEWDYWSCCPDIYVKLLNNAEDSKATTDYVSDATKGKDYTFTSDLPYTITDPQSEYILRLYDYDSGSADDLMGGIKGTFYNQGNDFPKFITIQAGDIKYEIELEYAF